MIFNHVRMMFENVRSVMRWFGFAFMGLAVFMLIVGMRDHAEWNRARQYGVPVEAKIVSIVNSVSTDDDWEVIFSYTYNGEDYTYSYLNYPENRYAGKVITAYLYPENPAVLYPYGSTEDYYISAAFGVIGLAMFIFGMTEFFAPKKTPEDEQKEKARWAV